METQIIFLLLAGAFGALIKEILDDNKLKLPKKIDGELALGFLGSLIVGAFAGWAIDGSLLTAAMAGFSGFAVIGKLVSKKNEIQNPNNKSVEEIIRYIAAEEDVDPDLAVRVAKCESNFDPNAKNTNPQGSVDRGLFQINSKFHPEVTDSQAFDPIFSTRFFCKAFKAGKLSEWNATKKCWEK